MRIETTLFPPARAAAMLLACALLATGCQRGEVTAPPVGGAGTRTPADTPAVPVTPSATDPGAVADVVAAEPEFPTLTVTTLDGDTFDLAHRRGRWVVVNFWATWCAPCLKEMPELSALDARRDDVEVIGLAYEETTAAELQAFLAARPVVYPVAIVDVYAPPADFATPRGLPMTYLIAPDGRVAKKFLGPVTAGELDAAIAASAGASPAHAIPSA